jgi:hypothetical protein
MSNTFLLVISGFLVVLCIVMWILPNPNGGHIVLPGLPTRSKWHSALSATTTKLSSIPDDDGQKHQHEEILDKTQNEILDEPHSDHIDTNSVKKLNDEHLLSIATKLIDVSKFKPEEYAIVQYDSRPLKDHTYWLASAAWNRRYCKKHGHQYIYYTLQENTKCMSIHNKEMLADAWCKVKTMIQATKSKKYSNIKIFIYMDSDAVISKTYENKSLNDMLYVLQNRLKWDPNNKPMIFNQDGPCWWCNQVAKVGYTTCLNAGTVLWYNDHEGKSLNILNEWWNAALDSYKGESNPFRRKFRINWPWEQDRQMAIYHRNPKHIQIASQPLKAHIDINAGHDDWCLSHLAKSGCYISHHCEDKRSKKHMMNMYGMIEEESAHIPVQYLDKEV